MTLILSGTDGLSDVDGSAATPAIRGTDANTGIFFPAADTIAFSEGGAEVMRISSSGNVGIGTNSPGYTLDVVGSSRVYSSTAGLNTAKFGASRAGDYVFLDGLCSPLASNGYSIFGMRAYSSLASADVQVGGSEWVHEGAGTDNKSYYTISTHSGTALAERIRIDSSGNLLVGRTSAFAAGQGSNPSLQVSTAGSGGIVLTNGSNALLIYRDNTNQITYFFNGSNQASLSAAGAWTNASDAKLKKEITTIKYGLDTVLATQPRSYKRVDVDGDYVGFVAQELKEQVPEVVFGSDTVQYSVDYGSLVAVAFKAIQELKALADTQASTITTLTDRITALENK